MENFKRIKYLDSLRGFAILLVVVGHLIQYNYHDFLNSYLFNVIYSFHMPLFFFISGSVRALHGEYQQGFRVFCNTIGKRFYALVVPSIVWSSIVPLFCLNTADFSFSLKSGYWFLNTLFVIDFLWDVFSFVKVKFKKKFFFSIIALALIAIFYVLGIKRISISYLIMYIIGFYFQRYNFIKKMNGYIYSFLLLIFLLFVGSFRYGYDISGSPERVWLQMPLSICASFCLVYFFSIWELSKGKIFTVLGFLGRYTLGIYLAHFAFVKIGDLGYMENNLNLLLQYSILLVVAVVISLLCVGIQYVLKPFGLLYSLMYGKLFMKKRNECNR